MFGLELWFILALLSTISGGIASFIYKIASVHKINATILGGYSGAVSATIIAAIYLLIGDFSSLGSIAIIFAFLASATFFVTQVIKIEALQHIDTAIFFPLYKVSGPFLAIMIGILFFAESFSTVEWLGLILSLLVPLLLITQSENARQKNLLKGIWLVLLCAIISAVSISFTKQGTDLAQNIWAYILFGEFFMVVTALLSLYYKYRNKLPNRLRETASKKMFLLASVLGTMHALGAYTLVFAFYHQGPLGIVYTINSLYILIPIILSIMFYNEHWNARKVVAIILSIAALGLLK